MDAVVSCGLGTALDELVPATDLDVALAEEHKKIVEFVVGCARSEFHHLILKIIFLLLDLSGPLYHHLGLASGDAVDGAEIDNHLFGEGELRGKWVRCVEGKWCAAHGLECLGINAGYGGGTCFDRREKDAGFHLVQL